MGALRLAIRDQKEAMRFISSLDRKTIKARFSTLEKWRTDHVAMAYVSGQAVAMVDALDTFDAQGATASLIARPGYGAYAIHALVFLKKKVVRPTWFSTLREPNEATVAISRRYFDYVYDQGAWELYSHLMKTNPSFPNVPPTPLATTDKMRADLGLPRIDRFSTELRREVLKASSNPDLNDPWVAPSGLVAGSSLMALAFDLVGLPFKDRQAITRLLTLTLAAQFGQDVDIGMAQKIADPKAFSRFMDAVRLAL